MTPCSPRLPSKRLSISLTLHVGNYPSKKCQWPTKRPSHVMTSSGLAHGATLANTSDVVQNRQGLSRMLQMHGYSACREALVVLEDHFTSSTKYESLEDFITKLNHIITFETDSGSSIIDPDLAHAVVQKLSKRLGGDQQQQVEQQTNNSQDGNVVQLDDGQTIEVPSRLQVKLKNVHYEPSSANKNHKVASDTAAKQTDEFAIHYNFLFKRLSQLPIFQGDFQLMKLSTLTASSQPSIRCICFGLLVKDVSKIDGYLLIDSTGRVPVRITPDTAFRNRLAYVNCIVLIEGVYVNPDDVLFAANIGLPPILLDRTQHKSLACVTEKLVVILKELYLDDEDVVASLDMLFTGYNSMEDPPVLFILIGDFTRSPCADVQTFRSHMKKLIRIIRTCDNLKSCHFVFVPGQNDTTPVAQLDEPLQRPGQPFLMRQSAKGAQQKMPKAPLTKEQVPVQMLALSDFNNIHLATNPCHIYLGERLVSVVAHSYIKELGNNLIHDLSDHREELFDTVKKIILSNGHLSAGISKFYHGSMNLWHRPDLLVLADTEAFGNRYDYISSSPDDTSFTTVPSFARQSNQFKVYYLKSGEVEDSQVSSDAYQEIEEVDISEDGDSQTPAVDGPSELD